MQHGLGQWLVEQGALTPEQRDAVLRRQRELSRRIGELAVERGLVDDVQMRSVLERQRGEDAPFGELAVKMGFLRPGELDELLFSRMVRHRPFGEVCVMLGYLDKMDCDTLVDSFSGQQRRRREAVARGLERLQDGRRLAMLVGLLERLYLRTHGERLRPSALPEALHEAVDAGSLATGYAFDLSMPEGPAEARFHCDDALFAYSGEAGGPPPPDAASFFTLVGRRFQALAAEDLPASERDARRIDESREDMQAVLLAAPRGSLAVGLVRTRRG